MLERLGSDELTQLLERAEGVGLTLPLDATARDTLIAMADGDGRALINLVEQVHSWRVDAMITDADLRKRLTRRAAKYDKAGFTLQPNLCVQNPCADRTPMPRFIGCADVEGVKIHDTWPAAFYAWRLRISADPQAQAICIKAWETHERLGSPEGELALSQAVISGTGPKSNAGYAAYKSAQLAFSWL